MTEIPAHIYDDVSIEILRKSYVANDPTTWPFYPIVMPMTKDGQGPATGADIHTIYFEVWDKFCNAYVVGASQPAAIKAAMMMNEELFK